MHIIHSIRSAVSGGRKKGLPVFLLLYLVFYTTDAAAGYFMIYLKSIGFDAFQMGLLTAAAALTAMLFQPFVGQLADRAQTKNAVLQVTLVLSACTCLLLRLSHAFGYILGVYTVYLVARNTLHPLTDTITLEYAARQGIDFGPIRTMGCVGYAAMAVVAGRVAARDPADTFVLYAFAAACTLAVVACLPKSQGMQRSRKSVHPMRVFRNRELLIYTLLAVALSCTKSYYHQYFSVYYTSDLGGTADLYGVLISLSAFMEIPVIFFIDRLNRRLGTRRVILLAGLLETLRWAVTALLSSPGAQLVVHALLGCNNMTLTLSMIIFVNRAMPPETKTTGQAAYTMCTSIGSLLIGNLLGGFASSLLGMRPVFALCALVNLAAIALFAGHTHRRPA